MENHQGWPACKSLTRIKISAFLITSIYGAGIIFLLLHQALYPGLAVIGISILLICLGIAAFAVLLHRLFLSSLELESRIEKEAAKLTAASFHLFEI
ncbi:DUF2975 domain-containing protein [Terribacillus sp. 179-K 1B1 HS]|uniref:DUF2975 domain-containing protein n=1 Tax=Terribacillus sp. 179-K 1B1 HS TaxID=3142388 RepID=UPI0039A22503